MASVGGAIRTALTNASIAAISTRIFRDIALRPSEDVTTVDQLVTTLDSANITANQNIFRVRVSDIQRIFDSEDDTVLHAITLNVTQKAQ